MVGLSLGEETQCTLGRLVRWQIDAGGDDGALVHKHFEHARIPECVDL